MKISISPTIHRMEAPPVELVGWPICKQIVIPSHHEHQTGWDRHPWGGAGGEVMLQRSRNTHMPCPALPTGSSRPSLGVCCLNRSNLRRNGGLTLPTAFHPTPPLLTKAPKVITMKKWVSIAPTLTMFSKNEDNKHRSLLSKQELSAFNAKKQKKQKKT